ncbi:MAG: AAA family ATPase, partial [Verrucomicrobiota bacterium]
MPQIRAKNGFPRGGVFPLGDRELTIGRDPESDIQLELDSPASRHHATVYKALNIWHLKDLGSLNGTEWNGTRIKDQALKHGDTITIGEAVFVFEDSASHGSQPYSPASLSGPATPEDEKIRATVCEMSAKTERLKAEISKAIIGQKEIVDELLTAIISNGHVLMIGMPGLAKTMMIRTVAEVLDLQFRRIQFTPDLMPSDITGTDILEVDEATGHKEYRFIKGPIFTNILLADEINRTPPKTQAALLEAMGERRVTAGGETRDLPKPYFVLATQNPIEQEGTYPLPEAQLDRFMFCIRLDYP